MIIFPAIDIKNGSCVRLYKGDMNTAEKVADSFLSAANSFYSCGAEWIHMVDLDGAVKGEKVNSDIFTTVAEKTGLRVELGGGIRTMADVEYYLSRGISRVIIGSAALKNPDLVREAAKKYGTIVSYDLNYRPSLWKAIGGKAKAQEVNREIAKYVDVMIGNEEDFTACLGFEVEGLGEDISNPQAESFKKMIEKVVKTYPNFKAVATTLRKVHTATVNDWSAICWSDGKFYESKKREKLEIFDRVGGGDSFASGFVYGMMELGDAQAAVEYGAAHGALAMTTPGDTSTATKAEVEKLAGGGSARVDR